MNAGTIRILVLWLTGALSAIALLLTVGCSATLPPAQTTASTPPTAGPASAGDSGEQWSETMDSIALQLAKTLKESAPRPLKIAVFDLTTPDGGTCGLGSIAAEDLTTKIFRFDEFEVIERRQLSKVLEEQKMSASDLLDPNSAARVGRVLGAKGIVTGTITSMGEHYCFNVRIILVESSSVVAVADSKCQNNASVAALGNCSGGGGGASHRR